VACRVSGGIALHGSSLLNLAGSGIQDSPPDLETLAQVCERFNWVCHAYCQMSNQYHLVVETAEANLSKGMRQLNGVYTQRFNRSHQRVGHVFQGRFKAIPVDKDSYLLELARYVILNPLRAKIVRRIEQWQPAGRKPRRGVPSNDTSPDYRLRSPAATSDAPSPPQSRG
jgi:REP element-mobilizing transposase RayT